MSPVDVQVHRTELYSRNLSNTFETACKCDCFFPHRLENKSHKGYSLVKHTHLARKGA